MADFTVTDRRYSRALPSIPGSTPEPVQSVTVLDTEATEDAAALVPMVGDTPVTGIQAAPWDGWPGDWQQPWSTFGDWGRGMGRLNDVAWNAIDLNSGILSTMPTFVRDRAGGRTDPDDYGAPSWLLNPEPLVYTCWEDMARQAWWSYWATGEIMFYATAWDADGYPTRFIVLHPAYVNVTGTRAPFDYSLNDGTPLNVGGRRDLLHVRYAWSPNDPRGMGPLEAGGARVVAAEMLAKYSAELAANGGLPMAVLSTDKRLTKNQSDRILADWTRARRSRLGLPAVLSDGVTLSSPVGGLKDVALAELGKFSESRVANLMGVPPFLVGLPSGGDSMTYSNVSSLFDFHWRAHLRPKSQLVMSPLSGWLLPRGKRVMLDRDDYVRPGFQELTQGLGTLASAGAVSPTEMRNQAGIAGSAPAPAAVATEVATEDPTAAANAMKAQFDALGAGVRAGVVPEDVAARVGLTGLRFTGAIPTTLRPKATDAAALEGGPSGAAPTPAPAASGADTQEDA